MGYRYHLTPICGKMVTVSALIGGTTSVVSGGKFASGAITGAFVYMFNHALHENLIELKRGMVQSTSPNSLPKLGHSEESRQAYLALQTSLHERYQFLQDNPTYMSHGVSPLLAVVPAIRAYKWVMVNPEKVIAGIYVAEVINDMFNSSMPPTTPHGAAYNFAQKAYEWITE
jgi:hypothetical protein